MTASTSAVTGGTQVATQLKTKGTPGTVAATGTVKYVSSNTHLAISGATDANGVATVTFTPEQIVDEAAVSLVADENVSGQYNLTISNTKTGTDSSGNTVNTAGSSSSIGLKGSGIALSESNGILTLSNTGGVKSVANAFDANGQFTTTITLLTDATKTSSAITPTIRYGYGTTSDSTFANGVAVLNVYTKAQVDDKLATELRAVNAMTFKGAVGSSGQLDLPTTNVQNGDTYKVAAAGAYGNGDFLNCRIGDMFIATGAEGNDGYIPTADIVWTYIPSGNDDVQAYTLRYNTSNSKIELINSNNTAVSSIEASGTDIVLGGSSTAMTIAHNSVTRTDTTGTAVSQTSGSGSATTFTAVTAITTSSTGHVTGVETTQISIADEFNKLKSMAITSSIEANTGNAKINVAVTDQKNYSVNADIVLHSDSLTFSTNNNITSIEMQWGSF